MSTLTGKKKSPRSRIGKIGHSVSVHTVEVGHKAREEFDERAPKVTAATSDALQAAAHTTSDVLHTAAHTAAERSRPIRTEAAARGSAALAGLLGEVTPAQIEKMSRRASRRSGKRRSRGRTAVLLTVAGAAAWLMWWKRSGTTWDPRLADVPADPEAVDSPVDSPVDGFAGS